MTTTRVCKFIATKGATRCYGANHREQARIGFCSACLAVVGQNSETGKLYDLRQRVNANGNHAYDYACWNGTHHCDPEHVARVDAERDAKMASGEPVLGAAVTVVRGRKVPKGTTGTLAWLGKALDFNGREFIKAGVRNDDGMHFVPLDYLKLTDNPEGITHS